MTMKLASSPSRNCSITTRAPAAPSVCATSISSTAACASSREAATTTPLPAARPSALTTIGAARASMYACASAASVNVWKAAVGIRWRVMNVFAKSFELSSCAAARVGPKMRKSAARNASTIPAASGASGPTMVIATGSLRANSTSAAISVNSTLVTPGSRAVPAFPGATNTFASRLEVASFHASACSRPPPPTTRTFNGSTPPCSLERNLAEEVQHAAVVDATAEVRDVRRQHFDFLRPDGEQRQQHRHRPAAGDVRPLNDHRGESETTLNLLALAPVRAPRVAHIELRLPMRILEDEEEHTLAVTVRSIDGASQTAAPCPRVFGAAPVCRPGPRQMPRIPGDQQFVAAVLIRVDEAPASLVHPFPEVGAFRRLRGRNQAGIQRGDDGGSLHRISVSKVTDPGERHR